MTFAPSRTRLVFVDGCSTQFKKWTLSLTNPYSISKLVNIKINTFYNQIPDYSSPVWSHGIHFVVIFLSLIIFRILRWIIHWSRYNDAIWVRNEARYESSVWMHLSRDNNMLMQPKWNNRGNKRTLLRSRDMNESWFSHLVYWIVLVSVDIMHTQCKELNTTIIYHEVGLDIHEDTEVKKKKINVFPHLSLRTKIKIDDVND